MKKNTMIISILIIIAMLLVAILINAVNVELLEIKDKLEQQLILNEQQDQFNQMVAQQAVTREMLQQVLENYTDYIINELLR